MTERDLHNSKRERNLITMGAVEVLLRSILKAILCMVFIVGFNNALGIETHPTVMLVYFTVLAVIQPIIFIYSVRRKDVWE